MASEQGSARRQDPYAQIFGKRYSHLGNRGGRHDPHQGTAPPDVVLVWDLDETLITFHSLINGSFAAGASLQVQDTTRELGGRWEHAALDLLDTHFFYDELDDHNLEHIGDADQARGHEQPSFGLSEGLTAHSLPAATWAHVQQRYNGGLASLAGPGQAEHWAQLYEATNELTGGWLQHGAQLLRDCTAVAKAAPAAATQAASAGEHAAQRQAPAHVANVLVSAGQLVATLAKLLLFRLDGYFPIENVYSSAVRGKQQCFARIQQRFHQATSFCVIGDSEEEQQAAESQRWHFTRISTAESCWHAYSRVDMQQPSGPSFCHPLLDVTASNLVTRPQA
ncbi:hypothetical protein WJX74_007877 [Apatococcus lobatus]|uniref:protein-tyrosine-phosphatase n=2 Tax=Apatococcus TaxID=904362 RepID=A0AAW1S3R1_9CHLO